MTREEAIKYFKRHLDLYCVDGISREAEKMAIKALEQEPILDKIIDEVCDIDDKIVLNPDSLFERKAYVRFNKVIDIIDKYKAKSEDKE